MHIHMYIYIYIYMYIYIYFYIYMSLYMYFCKYDMTRRDTRCASEANFIIWLDTCYILTRWPHEFPCKRKGGPLCGCSHAE